MILARGKALVEPNGNGAWPFHAHDVVDDDDDDDDNGDDG